MKYISKHTKINPRVMKYISKHTKMNSPSNEIHSQTH